MAVLVALVAVSIAAALWAGLKDRAEPDHRVRAALVAGGLALLCCDALTLAARHAGAAAPFAAALALASLVLWSALAVLAFHRLRGRDFFWIVPFGLFGGLSLAAGSGPVTMIALLTLPAVARARWRDRLAGRALPLVTLGALIAACQLLIPGPAPMQVRGATAGALFYADWARQLAGAYMLLALPGLLERWMVRLRRVSRRLALLLAFAGVVPLALLGALWTLSTVLGMGAERALIAARLLDAESQRLRQELQLALEAPDPPAPALRRLAIARAARWPGMRVWLRDPGWSRVAGDPARGDSEIAAWPDSLASRGVLRLETRYFLAARADLAGPPARTAIVLVPLEPVLGDSISRVVGARVLVEKGLRRLAPDSLAAREARGWTSGDRPSLVYGGGRTTQQGYELEFRSATPLAGSALVMGLEAQAGHWSPRGFLLAAEVSPLETFGGLARNFNENIANALPLALLALMVILLMAIAIVNVRMVRALGRSITSAVGALRAGAAALGEGRLDHRIEVRGDDDLWSVADAFNRAAAGLERGRELERERERIESELQLARRIQARLLPGRAPEIPGLEIAGRSESARQVGGDYYDHIPIGERSVALVIADVSGKGVPAALLMSGFRASLLSQDLADLGPGVALERVNLFLHRSVEPGRFVTAFLAVLDARSGRLAYSNAGHNPPLLFSAHGAPARLETGGTVLGVLPESRYEVGEAALGPADRLVLYTDGVTEAQNESDELWGEERLADLVGKSGGASCEQLIDGIVSEVRAFEGARGQSDDITLLIARRTG